jgi:hypothetical protein
MVFFFKREFPPCNGSSKGNFLFFLFSKIQKNVFPEPFVKTFTKFASSPYAGIIRIRFAGLRKSFLLSAGLPASTPFIKLSGTLYHGSGKVSSRGDSSAAVLHL